MKTTPSLTSVIFSAVVFAAGAASAANFGEDVAFLKKHTDVIVLRDKAFLVRKIPTAMEYSQNLNLVGLNSIKQKMIFG